MAAENFKVKKGLEVGTGATITSEGVNVTGIITATQFKGDGSGLTGVVGSGSGVVIKDEGSTVGTAGTINFVGSGIAAAISEGTATVTLSAGSLNNIVEDTTPQLGGNLDLNSKDITGSGDIDITGNLDISGISTFGDHVSIPDDKELRIGNSDDLKLVHTTSLSSIQSSGVNNFTIRQSVGSGFLFIHGDQLHLRSQSTNEPYLIATNNGPVSLYYDQNNHNTAKLITTATGVTIDGTAVAGGLDISGDIDVDGQTELDDLNVSGITTLGSSASGSVVLKHGGNQKLITTINGIEVPDLNATGVGTVGRLDTNGVTLGTNNNTFAAKFIDDAVINVGTGNDLQISHANDVSLIRDTRAGAGATLAIGADKLFLRNKDGNENYLEATDNGSVKLFYDFAPKLETDQAGVKITGVCTATSFSGDGSGLTGITASGSGIIIKHDGSTVGTAGTINFSTNLDVSPISAGIVTVTASGSSGVSLSGSTNNTVATVTGANALIGEANLTFDGSTLGIAAGSSDNKIQIDGSAPYIQFREGTTNKAYIQWNASGFLEFRNEEDDSGIRLSDDLLYSNNAFASGSIFRMWHAGNDGSGSGLDADLLDGQEGSYYTNASNLGVGTIPNGRFPATLPAVSGANLTSLTAGNISGTLPAISGANLTNLTAGNISGTLSSSQIADDAVTFAKMQNVGTGVFIGRNDSGSGDIETLTAAEARTLLNVADGATVGITTAPSNIVATWNVVNNGASSYRFTGPGQSPTADNPDIYLVRGKTYRFALSASGHPFQIRVSNGGSAYNDGVTNNGAQTGNVEFYVQSGAPASLVYQCTSHGGMVGNIYIIGGIQVGGATTLGSNSADGVVDLQRAGTSRLMTETFGISVNGDIMYQDALVHIGDTDTRIRFPANDTITAETAGTERLRIESNGDVEWNNIGTPTPGYNNSTVGMGFEPRNGTIFLSRADNLLIHANRNNDGRMINFAQGGTQKFNIGLKNSGADLAFNSGTSEGTERLRILSDGRIGINTTTVFDTNTMLQVTGKTGAGPNLVLHRNDTSVSQNQVLAALRVTGNDSDGTQQESSAIEFVADADHGTGDKPGRLVFKTTNDGASSSTEKVRITESGRVGILETNPQSSLQVKGGIRSAQTPGNGHIDLKHDGSNGSLVSSYGSFLFYNTVDTGEYFFHTKSSNSQVMKITADGTLEVKHSGGGNGVAINGISGEDVGVIRQRGDNHHAIILRGSSNADGSTITGGNTMEFREYGSFIFKTGTGTMAERVRIMDSELKLTCNQTFNANNTYYIGTNAIKPARIYSNMFVYREGTGGSVTGGGQTAEVIKFDNLGITMLHDSITLSTAATFSAMTGNRAGALLRMRNNTGPVIYSENGAVTVANASDYRIKENIVGITSAMSTVKKLNPVSYNIKKSWNPDDKGDRIQGFIAHEVQEVITDNAGVVLGKKDAVNPDGSVDAQGIDYAKLTPVLTAAVKELIAEVETLKAEVAALKSS